jgi:quinone-modifying oxidoreductase subunit QmoB
MERIGLMLCTGCGIGDRLDAEALAKLAGEAGAGAATLTHRALCSQEGVAAIRSAIEKDELDGLLIAACSSRVKTQELRFDRDGCVVERVSLREQVIWSHPKGEEDTQMLAEDLLRMGGAKLQKMKPVEPLEEEISTTVLVVGGGLTGLEAARATANCGFEVVVVEKSDKLGGYLAGLPSIPPQLPPFDKPHESPIPALVSEIESNDSITVFTSSKILSLEGQPGQFDLKLESPDGEQSLRVGAVIQATGALPYDAEKLGELGRGEHADVITSHELEEMLAGCALKRPSDGAVPQRVLFVQCAGSRDPQHLSYCSSECCLTSLKQVSVIHDVAPDTETIVVYRDMRTPGQTERFYQAVQEHPKTFLTRGDVEKVAGNGNGALAVHVKNSLLGDDVVLPADLVVLAVGMVPNAADGEGIRIFVDATRRAETGDSDKQKELARQQAAEYARHEGTEILNLQYRQGPDMPVLEDNFPDSHYICFPYETRRTGIYAAGTLRAPMESGRASEDGWGAAMKAMQCITAATRGEAVHPRAGDTAVPDFFLQRCTQCKRCTEECPFGTLNEDEKGTPQLNALRCRRCGICMGACPERIVSFPEYSVDAVSSMVKAMEVPEDFEEKPRILGLFCENDALPALDAAAAKRIQWNPWVRIVPVRCLGSVNIVWMADALARGIDGVILIGCVSGDDYQCHYIKGSELANKRLENVQETLQRLVLEPERIRVLELSHDEFERVPKELDDFAEVLEELGPNPMKGF